MGSYEDKAPRVRIDAGLHEYLKRVSAETGLSKVKVSGYIAKSLTNAELNILNKKKVGIRFDFKI